MKIVPIIGARPQFIKAAAVRRAIHNFNQKLFVERVALRGSGIQETLVHTGQHYDYMMDKVFFEELRLPRPRLPSGGRLRVTREANRKRCSSGLRPIFREEKPEGVLVYGDTNSTLAGALAAAKMEFRWPTWRQV